MWTGLAQEPNPAEPRTEGGWEKTRPCQALQSVHGPLSRIRTSEAQCQKCQKWLQAFVAIWDAPACQMPHWGLGKPALRPVRHRRFWENHQNTKSLFKQIVFWEMFRLETKAWFDTGRKCLKSFGFSPCFFNSGITTACLNWGGMVP